MRIQLASIKALTGVIALLCLKHVAAYDDSDFLRDWKDWNNHGGNGNDAGKTRNLVSSRRNVFKVPKDNGNDEKKPADDTNLFDDGTFAAASGGGDVTPFIVGGTVVNPPRKYKV